MDPKAAQELFTRARGPFDDAVWHFNKINTPANKADVIEKVIFASLMRMPENMTVMHVSGPMTGGKHAMLAMEEVGVHEIRELAHKPEHKDVLVNKVLAPNDSRMQRRYELAMKLFPEAAIINPFHSEGAVRARKQLKQELKERAKSGETENGSSPKLWSQHEWMAYWHEFYNQNVNAIFLERGWAFSNGTVDEVMECACIASGLRDSRPGNMQMFLHSDQHAHPIDLGHISKMLGGAANIMMNKGFNPHVQMMGLARTFRIHDLLMKCEVDQACTNKAIVTYDKAEMEARKKKWEPILLSPKHIVHIPVRDLDPIYAEAREEAEEALKVQEIEQKRNAMIEAVAEPFRDGDMMPLPKMPAVITKIKQGKAIREARLKAR